MIQRTCLLVDDSRQDDIFPAIVEEGKKYNIEITCLQFNVGNPERRDLLTNEEIDLDKVVNIFREEFRGQKIDLIAFDWNLSGSSINGPLVIKAFNDNDIRIKIPKILYSGILKEEIQKLCDNYRINLEMPFKEIWSQISALISAGIVTFASRDHYEIAIVEQLRRTADSIESTVEDIIRKYPDFVFKSAFVNAAFKGKKYSEIVTMIERDSALRNEFTSEITKHIISYLTESIPNG